jgi:hypothetical protein
VPRAPSIPQRRNEKHATGKGGLPM